MSSKLLNQAENGDGGVIWQLLDISIIRDFAIQVLANQFVKFYFVHDFLEITEPNMAVRSVWLYFAIIVICMLTDSCSDYE